MKIPDRWIKTFEILQTGIKTTDLFEWVEVDQATYDFFIVTTCLSLEHVYMESDPHSKFKVLRSTINNMCLANSNVRNQSYVFGRCIWLLKDPNNKEVTP